MAQNSAVEPRVALVHDYLISAGGAERTLLAMCKAFPNAPIYTALYDARNAYPEFRDMDVRPSFLQVTRAGYGTFKALLPLFPAAFASMRFEAGTTIVSSVAGMAKCVPNPGAHVCYCHTPPRYLWSFGDSSRSSGFIETATRVAFGRYLRSMDLASAARVDRFVANSQAVAGRIKTFYGRESTVIYPPTDIAKFSTPRQPADYYLVAGRLNHWKHVDVAISACEKFGRPLVIVGDGPERRRLAKMAGPFTRLVGRNDSAVPDLMARARAVIVAGHEDWGIVAVEAAAAGCPVIAADAGGNRETVRDGITGYLYGPPYDATGLIGAMRRFEVGADLDEATIRQHAQNFSQERFIGSLQQVVAEVKAENYGRGKPKRLGSRSLRG